MWAYFLTSKDQAFSTFKEFRQHIEMEMRMKLRMLRTDKGGEFTSNEFTKYCKENGIARQLTAPYSPQQNGVDWDNNGKETSTQDTFWASFVVEGVDNKNPTPFNTENNDNTYQEQEPNTDPDSPITPPAYTYNSNSEEEEEATISSLGSSNHRFDDTPKRGFKDLTEIYHNAREVKTETLLFTEEEPRNYKEASKDEKWIEAMEIELDSINKNNTWTLTTLPTNQKAIGLKWVFKTKRDVKGKIIKYKARLVAKGYVQEQGIDFDEVFVPVDRIETVRLILALAAYHGWQKGNDGKVYRLIKALYGLRQAPRAWNIKSDNTLKSLDFKKCALEQAIYTKASKDSLLLVGVYVDNLIITGTPKKEIDETLNDIYKNTKELLLAEDEPKNYKEASNDQKWIEAIKDELDSINRNNTCVLTTLPTGDKAIGLKWVFKIKKDANGNIIKHKA
nr:ribonuclease H-like domain, reverse transcriptase, RNA-dependent DNA polymerase [Tanacetum cinerariifolium]